METFPIQSLSLARVRRVQLAQHLAAAVILIGNGWRHVSEGHVSAMPLAEIAAGVLLIGAAIRERVLHRHSRIGWVELAGAALTFVEAINRMHERHHLLFYVLNFLQPVALLLFGIFDVQMQARPRLAIDETHFEMRLRTLLRTRVPLANVRAFRITPQAVEFERTNGSVRRLRTRNIGNRDEAMAWTREQLLRRGLVER